MIMKKKSQIIETKVLSTINTQVLKTTFVSVILTSSYLVAGSCSNGFCGVTVPQIPTDIQDNTALKPFSSSSKIDIEKNYNGWILADNGGDDIIGENRLMTGVDFNSFLKDGDKVSLFGMLTSESLKSGKLSYAYPLSWKSLTIAASYIYTNYALEGVIPGSSGIGTTGSVEGKIIYSLIDSEKEKSNIYLSFNNNNIGEEMTYEDHVRNSDKKSYSSTAHIDFVTEKYPVFGLNTSQKISINITTGYLSFDNIDDEKLDRLTYNVQGSYSKINLDYNNAITISDNTSLETNFRSQFALNNKNLDDSEAFTVGGINGVKVYEEGSVYASNGVLVNIEAKYQLPKINGVNNSIGTFYDYGQVWMSQDIIPSTEHTTVQDAGIGIYTNYKKFFSKVQTAFELGDSEVSTKKDKKYRVILQAGFSF